MSKEQNLWRQINSSLWIQQQEEGSLGRKWRGHLPASRAHQAESEPEEEKMNLTTVEHEQQSDLKRQRRVLSVHFWREQFRGHWLGNWAQAMSLKSLELPKEQSPRGSYWSKCSWKVPCGELPAWALKLKLSLLCIKGCGGGRGYLGESRPAVHYRWQNLNLPCLDLLCPDRNRDGQTVYFFHLLVGGG